MKKIHSKIAVEMATYQREWTASEVKPSAVRGTKQVSTRWTGDKHQVPRIEEFQHYSWRPVWSTENSIDHKKKLSSNVVDVPFWGSFQILEKWWNNEAGQWRGKERNIIKSVNKCSKHVNVFYLSRLHPSTVYRHFCRWLYTYPNYYPKSFVAPGFRVICNHKPTTKEKSKGKSGILFMTCI